MYIEKLGINKFRKKFSSVSAKNEHFYREKDWNFWGHPCSKAPITRKCCCPGQRRRESPQLEELHKWAETLRCISHHDWGKWYLPQGYHYTRWYVPERVNSGNPRFVQLLPAEQYCSVDGRYYSRLNNPDGIRKMNSRLLNKYKRKHIELAEAIGRDFSDGVHLSSYEFLSQYLIKKIKLLAENVN